MESTWLFIIGFFLVGIIALKWASKLMSVLMGFIFIALAVLGVMYIMNAGPFKRDIASIAGLEEQFCNEPSEVNKCDCIVRKIEKDIRQRFTAEEIRELEENRLKMLNVAIKSYLAQEDAIDACLEERGASEEKAEFFKEVFDQKGLVGKAKGMIHDFVEDYQEIEEKYDDED